MMTCDRLRALLEEHGLEGLQSNEEGRAHAAECTECFALLEAYGEVDRALASLPSIDAPDALVERVLAAPKPAAVPLSRARRFSRRLLGGGAIAAALLVGLFSSTLMMTGRDAAELRSEPAAAKVDLPGSGEIEAGEHTIVLEKEGYFGPAEPKSSEEAQLILDGKLQREQNEEGLMRARGDLAAAEQMKRRALESPARQPAYQMPPNGESLDGDELAANIDKQVARDETVRWNRREVDRIAVLEPSAGKAALEEVPGPDDGPHGGGLDLGILAPSFWKERDRIDALSFVAAEGYWQNTYTPGDPIYRMLAAKLAEAGIEDQARPYAQPFDAPRNAALAVSMASDRAAVEGEARVLLQVGLKGATEYGRRRPTMNLALVVDAQEVSGVETAKAIRAVVMSFAKAKQPGDRVALFIAGKPGVPPVDPKRFEYGAVAVAMQDALSDRPIEGAVLTMTEATRRAIELVAGADDETAPLGASAVVLVTHRSLGVETERLADMAHQSAVAGIVVTAVGVGRQVSIPELDRISLSGQGNRRLVASAEAADKAVDSELSSVSRVVARAVRLRIRLAPGVKLVNVLGSRRLDDRESQRAREAEKSIDLRLSRHLGIEADRGEDEDGIQIVIPSYYANDEHPILLDVVVPGPGPVADVQVRYKDLVYLKNGVARARLEIKRGRAERGPLQNAVLKNLVSQRISESLAEASRKLSEGDATGAQAELSSALALIREAAGTFVQDRELERDAGMISSYLQAAAQPDPALIDSMRFAAKAKILPAVSSSHR